MADPASSERPVQTIRDFAARSPPLHAPLLLHPRNSAPDCLKKPCPNPQRAADRLPPRPRWPDPAEAPAWRHHHILLPRRGVSAMAGQSMRLEDCAGFILPDSATLYRIPEYQADRQCVHFGTPLREGEKRYGRHATEKGGAPGPKRSNRTARLRQTEPPSSRMIHSRDHDVRAPWCAVCSSVTGRFRAWSAGRPVGTLRLEYALLYRLRDTQRPSSTFQCAHTGPLSGSPPNSWWRPTLLSTCPCQ
jgi:hypothetical protein